MESPGLGSFPGSLNLRPLPLVNVKLVDVIEPLLVGIHSTKYVNIASANNSGVPVPWLGRRSVGSVDFIPIIRQETVLVDIVHGVVTIPAAKNKHGVLEYNGRVTEPVKWLASLTLYFFPFVLSVSDAALVHVAESFFAVVATVHEQPPVPEHDSMICSLTRPLPRLLGLNIKPL